MSRSTVITWVVAVAVGVFATTLGLAYLGHPIAGWAYGIPRRSNDPPVIGVGLLAIPVLLAGLGVRGLWRAVAVARLRRQVRGY